MRLIHGRHELHAWTDPWGDRHSAFVVDGITDVTETTMRETWDTGYGEVACPVFTDDAGARFIRIPPMDPGAGSTYRCLDDQTWWTTVGREHYLLQGEPIMAEVLEMVAPRPLTR